MKKVTLKKDGNYLIRITIDENNNELEERFPIYGEDGKYNPDLIEIMRSELTAEQALSDVLGNSSEEKEDSSTIEDVNESTELSANVDNSTELSLNDDFDDFNAFEYEPLDDEEELREVVEITEGKPGWLKKAKFFLAGAVTIGAIVLACKAYGCGEDKAVVPNETTTTTEDPTTLEEPTTNNSNISETTPEEPTTNGPVIEETTTQESVPTVDENKQDTRYTTITEENLALATYNLNKEFEKYGIKLAADDVQTLVAVANITHLKMTNPDLLQTVLGENANADVILAKAGHIIGQIVALEVTTKDIQVDWTKALIDENDKKIAQHLIENVINASKEIAANSELTMKEKSILIQEIFQKNYIQPKYDKTIGYMLEDKGNGEKRPIYFEDGADFFADAILCNTGLGDNVLKNYLYGSKTQDALSEIVRNEDNVPNIKTIINDGCATEKVNVR